ncbi:hypothetical protein OG280_13650 [Streptomyces virginiae]|uniref:hypothetical protein n=1 Tax=Streptomyces virginiae TaxID=1961 RepID=UPI002DD7A854|nr:hypothetical protein [Streptomyces virginiae]WSC79794.1 hypothetical protein OHA56_27660 [Streptomyces virginiae]
MSRAHKKHLVAALTACLGALAYTVSKVDLAREGELGMPGFPAPAEAYAAVADVGTAQLANAALGLLMAVVALFLVRLSRTPLVRLPVLVVSWVGIVMVGAGVLGFGARAAGMAPSLGAIPPHMPTALAALLVGAVWVTAWTIAVVFATRSSR